MNQQDLAIAQFTTLKSQKLREELAHASNNSRIPEEVKMLLLGAANVLGDFEILVENYRDAMHLLMTED